MITWLGENAATPPNVGACARHAAITQTQRIRRQQGLSMSSSPRGCMMCHSLYISANGDIPCWDDVGESHILWQLDAADAPAQPSQALFHHPKLVHIRQSFIGRQVPFPGLCERCAVNGCGSAHELRPKVMQVLHIEASYLCHLSCPQCIPARDRKRLKEPPYHMTAAVMERVLARLRTEGVTDLQFVHFEGRGDPLSNPQLKDLIRLCRQYFPRTCIGATTHGSYPFLKWIPESELDLLRFSVDGARAETYSKYRIGGSFDKAINFMAALKQARDHTKSKLQVEWKYILFEWNDSDDEIGTAFAMSRELGVRLHFCLTHSPGKSMRFPTTAALQDVLRRVAPGASCDSTFQLRTDEQKMIEASAVSAQCASSSIIAALDTLRQGQEPAALSSLREALRHDPGLVCQCEHVRARDLLTHHLDEILARATSPATLSGLAAVCREVGDDHSSGRLLWRYLEIAPHAPDHDHVLQSLKHPKARVIRILSGIRNALSVVDSPYH